MKYSRHTLATRISHCTLFVHGTLKSQFCEPVEEMLREQLYDLNDGVESQVVVSYDQEPDPNLNKVENSGMLGGSSNLFSHISHGNYDFWDHNKRAMKYKGVYSAEAYGEKAVEVIENHANSKNENPMFLFLSFQVPHEPQQVPPSYINKWKSYANVKPERRKKLFGQISCMDEVVHKVVNSLKHNHLWNNTVVIFSSDNGGPFRNEASNIPLRGQKRTHFEGGIRVVGFVNSPLLSDEVQGKTFNGLIGIADWFPTFIEGMAGGQTDRVDIDGINVWDSLRYGTPSPREDYVISVGEECLGAPVRNNTKYWDTIGIDPRTSIRSGPWKLIVQQDDTEPSTKPADVLLFNVDLDITESTNLAEENEDIVRRLRQRVKEYCSKTVPIVSFKTKHFPKSSNDNQKGCQLDEKYIRRGNY
ncbi:Arylsulfatase B [Apostichopus japonicus]|uniref:Arylsulfatase B n=1 Tax=Stichopus japonicus TaxID=307972 RepID=A0A2G8L8K4_STIJA|nr:Arylsulfatase B [Apostichopus japonicus]